MTSTIIDRNGGTSSSSPVTDRNTGLSTSSATKGPCRVASVSNITLSGLQSIDGVTVAVDDRVLVAGQTDTTLNGIYIVSTGAWKRSPDFNRNDDVRKGSQVRVTSGSTYSGLWVLTSADPITMGTSAITWSRDTNLTNGALAAANNLSDLASAIGGWDALARYDSAQVAAPVATVLDLSTMTAPIIDVSTGSVSSITLANHKVRIGRLTGTVTFTASATLTVDGNTSGSFIFKASSVLLFEGFSTGVRVIVLNEARQKGSDVASAGTITLGRDRLYHVTGTTTITDIDWSDALDGNWAVLIFDGILTLTYNATTLKLPGNASITTAAGDRAFVVQDSGDNAIVLFYQRAATGTNLAQLDAAAQVITGGARVTSAAQGTVSSGTLTLDPGTRPMWDYTNNGAHTLAPGANTGSILLDITNGASAGAITVSGWTKVVGAFDTTNAHKFRCSCSIGAAGSLLQIVPLQ